MWNVAGRDEAEKLATAAVVKARFESLRGVVPGLLHLEIGVDVSRVDYACDIVLYSVFDSRETLAAYAVHPAHLKIREEIEGMRIARHQVDYLPGAQAGNRS